MILFNGLHSMCRVGSLNGRPTSIFGLVIQMVGPAVCSTPCMGKGKEVFERLKIPVLPCHCVLIFQNMDHFPMVICAGFAKEFDTPTHLLERPSLFGSLVQEYANRSSGL